jgi:hypothetical protein
MVKSLAAAVLFLGMAGIALLAMTGIASAHPVIQIDDEDRPTEPVNEVPTFGDEPVIAPSDDCVWGFDELDGYGCHTPVIAVRPVPEQPFAKPPPDQTIEEPPTTTWSCDLPLTLAPIEPSPESRSKLGFHFGGGKLPILGQKLQTEQVGVTFEHDLWGSLRIVAEYEYMWLGKRDTEMEGQDVIDGGGQRASLGLRRTITDSRRIHHELRFYLDGELGGGLMLADDAALSSPNAPPSGGGAIVRPYGYAGIRLGYDFFLRHGTQGSRVWEPELTFRAIKVEDGVGFAFGVGMTWGN